MLKRHFANAYSRQFRLFEVKADCRLMSKPPTFNVIESELNSAEVFMGHNVSQRSTKRPRSLFVRLGGGAGASAQTLGSNGIRLRRLDFFKAVIKVSFFI